MSEVERIELIKQGEDILKSLAKGIEACDEILRQLRTPINCKENREEKFKLVAPR